MDNQSTKTILVTGGSGYLASWIVKYLLEEGHTVHATVRDIKNVEKVQHLQDMAKESKGTLHLFNADLLREGSFQKAIEGCEVVIHTASPFTRSTKDPEKNLIEPALKGTENVLSEASKTPSVKRVVLTSSVAAIFGDSIDIRQNPKGIFDENDWNTTSSLTHQPYSYSKTLAEKKAWEMAQSQNQWDLVTINPGMILGPSCSQRTDATSVEIMLSALRGDYRLGIPELWFGMVDVRDVARAHVIASLNPKATGRHIVIAISSNIKELASYVKEIRPQIPISLKSIPKFLFWLMAPLNGFTREYVTKNSGIPIQLDNTKSKKALGMNYLPFKKTIADHIAQIEADNLLK